MISFSARSRLAASALSLDRTLAVGRLLPLGLVLFLLAGCVQQAVEQQASEPPAVGVIEVSEQQVNPFFEFVGKTRAAASVDLRARVTGFLQSREFEEGARVQTGEILFKIEPERYRASLAQAEAELAAAKASLNRARVDLERYKELAKAKNISQQKVDEAEADVLVQEAAVQTAQAGIQQAQLDVNYTEIVAPIGGRIDIARYDVGNLVGPDSGVLAKINLMDPIKVAFSIAETWYLELARRDLAEREAGRSQEGEAYVPLIRLPDGSLYEHKGEFDFYDNKVDEKTGTVLVRAVFDNPDELLLPGAFVTVIIERREAEVGVLIPQAAVLTDQAGRYVLLVNDENKAEVRRIETGQSFGANWLVEEGLEAGERIILYGIQKVRPGVEVKPELTEATPAPVEGASETGAAETPSAAAEGEADMADAPEATDDDERDAVADGDTPVDRDR